MAEDGTAGDGGQGDESASSGATGGEGKAFTQAELDRIVADRVARERAKYADYGDLKKKAAAAMTEQERAVAEAEVRGKTSAMTAAGGRLARAELRAAAAELHVDKATVDGFLEYADLSRFVGADGEPDDKAISAAIKKLAGSGGAAAGADFDGGARSSTNRQTDMNALIRRQAGLG
jgi:hypothetical protein